MGHDQCHAITIIPSLAPLDLTLTPGLVNQGSSLRNDLETCTCLQSVKAFPRTNRASCMKRASHRAVQAPVVEPALQPRCEVTCIAPSASLCMESMGSMGDRLYIPGHGCHAHILSVHTVVGYFTLTLVNRYSLPEARNRKALVTVASTGTVSHIMLTLSLLATRHQSEFRPRTDRTKKSDHQPSHAPHETPAIACNSYSCRRQATARSPGPEFMQR